MHCIEIMSRDFKAFRELVGKKGATVTVVSRYTDRQVRLLDVEVSKDSKDITRIEGRYAYQG